MLYNEPYGCWYMRGRWSRSWQPTCDALPIMITNDGFLSSQGRSTNVTRRVTPYLFQCPNKRLLNAPLDYAIFPCGMSMVHVRRSEICRAVVPFRRPSNSPAIAVPRAYFSVILIVPPRLLYTGRSYSMPLAFPCHSGWHLLRPLRSVS